MAVGRTGGRLGPNQVALAQGQADRMVAWWNRKVIDVPLDKIVGRSRPVDPAGTVVGTARALGICLGDNPAGA